MIKNNFILLHHSFSRFTDIQEQSFRVIQYIIDRLSNSIVIKNTQT